jgi:hypothetical protein
MSNQELAIRFTEETYASRSDIAKVLGTTIVDTIWQSVIQYRQPFLRYLAVKNIEKIPLFIVLTPAMLEKLNHIERQCVKAMVRLGKISPSIGLFTPLVQSHIVPTLSEVARALEMTISDRVFSRMIQPGYVPSTNDEIQVFGYYQSLLLLSEKRFAKFDEDILVSTYTTLTSQELIDLYREETLVQSDHALTLKTTSLYQGKAIEEAMSSLFEYVKAAQYSPIVKVSLVLYFVFAIAPFTEQNPLMAMILFKAYLSHLDYEHVPLYLTVETLLTVHKEAFQKVLQEVQKTLDLTYLVNFLIHVLDAPLQSLLDALVKLEGLHMQQERKLSRTSEDQEIAVQMKSIKTELKTMKPNEALAHEAVTMGLQDHEAVQLEEHLLEVNPGIKRLEAHFYARHCTIGKFYTIAQFKKKMSCAYETARTSMEHLTQLGYYRKEHYKNKFVYTPVSRK